MVGGEGGRQLYDDLATGCSGKSLSGKWRLGSAARISYELRPLGPGGGDVRLATSREETFALPVNTYGRGSSCADHVSFHRMRGLIERPVLRLAGSRSTQQSGVVKVSAVLVDLTQERVDQPVSTGPTGKNADTDCASQFARQAELGSDLSLREEVATGVDCRDFVVGGPTCASLCDDPGRFC